MRWLSVVLLAGAACVPLRAADGSHPCASVASPAQRLACYDKAFPLTPGVREAAVRQAQADFGLERGEPLRNPGQTVEEADPDRVEGRVARVEHGTAGRRSIHLEGGQMWVTVEATSVGQMRPGETVTLRKGVMGNYLLTTQGGASLRVKRVR